MLVYHEQLACRLVGDIRELCFNREEKTITEEEYQREGRRLWALVKDGGPGVEEYVLARLRERLMP